MNYTIYKTIIPVLIVICFGWWLYRIYKSFRSGRMFIGGKGQVYPVIRETNPYLFTVVLSINILVWAILIIAILAGLYFSGLY